MLLDADDSQLVLIDYQARLMPAIHEGQAVLAQAQRLAQIARVLQVPLWGTEQNPARLGENPPALRALCRQTLPKMSFSACDAGLVELLRPAVRADARPQRPPTGSARSVPRHLQKPAAAQPAESRATVVLAGVEAHVCLLQTALELLEQEFEVWVVTDASGSRRERDRDAAFDRLAGNGVELVSTEMVAFEWLRSAEHPAFKEVQALIK